MTEFTIKLVKAIGALAAIFVFVVVIAGGEPADPRTAEQKHAAYVQRLDFYDYAEDEIKQNIRALYRTAVSIQNDPSEPVVLRHHAERIAKGIRVAIKDNPDDYVAQAEEVMAVCKVSTIEALVSAASDPFASEEW